MRTILSDRLGDHSRSWDDLVEAQALPSPFLRSWWLDNAASGTVALVLCFEGENLVGGAAFEVDRFGRGRVAIERVTCLGQGTLAPDHLDVVAADGYDAAVTAAAVAWLRRPGSRLVDLDGLTAGGRLARAVADAEVERVGAPWAPLPDDRSAYIAARPGQLRSTLKRRSKQLTAAGASVHRVAPDEAPAALAELRRLHDGRWADESGFLDAWGAFAAAATAGMACGDVVIHELRADDGDVVATELDMGVGRRLAFYQAGRRTEREWRAAGSVLKADVIEWAINEGYEEYDLLRGDESYKSDWATERREIVRVRFGVGPVGSAVDAAQRAWRWTWDHLVDLRNKVRAARSATPGDGQPDGT